MTDILIPKKNVVLDATMLTALMKCGRFVDLRHNNHLEHSNGKSNSLECGSIVHKVLETYYKCIIGGMKRTDAINTGLAAGQLYVTGCEYCTNFNPIKGDRCPIGPLGLHTWNEDRTECIHCHGRSKPKCGHPVNEFPGVKNTPAESEGYMIGWKWALTTCEQYFEYYANDSWTPLEVEVVKSKILYEDDEIRILWKAKLDLTVDTNQGIYPTDHKTMKQNRQSTNLNNQFIGQCHIMETRNTIINKIGFQKTLPASEKFKRELVSYSAARLIEWQSEILPYWAKILLMYDESGYYPPNYSNCDGKFGNCVYMKVCESDPTMREDELKQAFFVGQEWNPTNDED